MGEWSEIGKLLIFFGLVLIGIGLLLLFGDKLPLKLGHLPGDIVYERENFKFYFPWVSCLVISIVLSLIFYFWRR
jgi:hypothetical protein